MSCSSPTLYTQHFVPLDELLTSDRPFCHMQRSRM
jgi:hypothetical protein